MKYLRQTLRANDQAQNIAEYALILAAIVLAILAALYGLWRALNGALR
jgi:Flp pilus assembly pilin Flp